jgi:hypothetical protein
MPLLAEPLYGESAGSVAPVVIIGPVLIPPFSKMQIGEIDLQGDAATLMTFEVSDDNGANWRRVRTYYLPEKGNMFRGYAAAYSPVDKTGGAGQLFRARIAQAIAAPCSVGINYIFQEMTGKVDTPISLYGEHLGAAGPVVIIPPFVLPNNLRFNVAEVDIVAYQETVITIQRTLDKGVTWNNIRRYSVPALSYVARPYDDNYPFVFTIGDVDGDAQIRVIFTQPGLIGPIGIGIGGRLYSTVGEVSEY